MPSPALLPARQSAKPSKWTFTHLLHSLLLGKCIILLSFQHFRAINGFEIDFSLMCTCIIDVVSKRDVQGSRSVFVSESCCRALGRAQALGTDVRLASILKGTLGKQGVSACRSQGFGALNFPVSHREMPDFGAASAPQTVPSLCSTSLRPISLHQISTQRQSHCSFLAY